MITRYLRVLAVSREHIAFDDESTCGGVVLMIKEKKTSNVCLKWNLDYTQWLHYIMCINYKEYRLRLYAYAYYVLLLLLLLCVHCKRIEKYRNHLDHIPTWLQIITVCKNVLFIRVMKILKEITCLYRYCNVVVCTRLNMGWN